MNIFDVYLDFCFDFSIDKKIGYEIRNVFCMFVYNVKGELIGVI